MKSKEDQGAVKAVKTRGKRRPIVITWANKPDYDLVAAAAVPLIMRMHERVCRGEAPQSTKEGDT